MGLAMVAGGIWVDSFNCPIVLGRPVAGLFDGGLVACNLQLAGARG